MGLFLGGDLFVSFLGEGDWIIDLDAVTDDAGNRIELTEDEEEEVIERILR